MSEVIILAGGLGTRLRSVVKDLPKPMADVNGQPFLKYLMQFWLSQGASHFILSVGYKKDKIMQVFGNQYEGIPISYAIEEEPLGTGGAILLAVRQLKENKPFVVVNGDTYFSVNFSAMNDFHQANDADLTMALYEVEQNTRYSGVQMEGAYLTSLEKRVDDSPVTRVNGGIYLISKSALNKFNDVTVKQSFEDDMLPVIIQEKKVAGYNQEGIFIDIGVPDDYYRAAEVLPRL